MVEKIVIAPNLTVDIEPLEGKSEAEISAIVRADHRYLEHTEKYRAVLGWDCGRKIECLLNMAKAISTSEINQDDWRRENFNEISHTMFFEYLSLYRTYGNRKELLLKLSGRQAKIVIGYVKEGYDLDTAVTMLHDKDKKAERTEKKKKAAEAKKKANEFVVVGERAVDQSRSLCTEARKHVTAAEWDKYAEKANAVDNALNAAKKAARQGNVEWAAQSAQDAVTALKSLSDAVKPLVPEGFVPEGFVPPDTHVATQHGDETSDADLLAELAGADTFDVQADGKRKGMYRIMGMSDKPLPSTVQPVFVPPGTIVRITNPDGHSSAVTVQGDGSTPALLIVAAN
jgi:hypothetical protein